MADLTEKPVLFWPVGSYLVVDRLRDPNHLRQIVAVLPAARDVPSDTRRPVNADFTITAVQRIPQLRHVDETLQLMVWEQFAGICPIDQMSHSAQQPGAW